MTNETLRTYWEHLRCIHLFRKRYYTPSSKPRAFWRGVARRYANMEKSISSSDYHWRIITYDDGRRELAFLRVLQGGILSGAYPALYRGLIIPHRITYGTFAHIKDITIAF